MEDSVLIWRKGWRLDEIKDVWRWRRERWSQGCGFGPPPSPEAMPAWRRQRERDKIWNTVHVAFAYPSLLFLADVQTLGLGPVLFHVPHSWIRITPLIPWTSWWQWASDLGLQRFLPQTPSIPDHTSTKAYFLILFFFLFFSLLFIFILLILFQYFSILL